MEENIPTFILGDQIEYFLVFTCRANIRTVSATFRNQDTGTELILEGEAQLMEKQTVTGTRKQEAMLYYSADLSEPPDSGRYRLARLVAQTYGGHLLDFDNPPEGIGFYFREESTEVLPRIILPESQFRLAEGHPNSPRR
jgi:hypothetical protein